jgi:hypothetical protein
VLVGYVVAWNAVMLVAIWLNGGMGRFRSSEAMLVAAFACLVTTVLASTVMLSGRVREFVLAPTRRDQYEPGPYFTIAVVAAALGIGFLSEVLGF